MPQLYSQSPIPTLPPAAAMISSLSLAPIPTDGADNTSYPDDFTWYGNIQYLLNISSIGALFCVLVFFLVKLRSDHRRIPGPTALVSKLLAVWHATGHEIARHCGADAAQFLIIEGGTFALLFATSFIAVLLILPVNLYAGAAKMDDQFSKTTITHIVKGSPALWFHFVFVVMVVVLAHYGICEIEKRLKITRLRDGYGNPSENLANTSAVFTIMVQGVPKILAANKLPFEEYFQERYPGKVYRVIVPMDLCALDRLVEDLVEVRNEISKLVAKIDAELVYSENGLGEYYGEDLGDGSLNGAGRLWKKAKQLWIVLWEKLGYTDDVRLRRLQEFRAELETEVAAYKAGHAPGAGVAFVVFKDVYTANRAVKDFRLEKKSRVGRFFPLMELQLERNRWKVERAPLATDIYWNHLGTTTLSLKLRRALVNTCLLLMLLFFSSPLAVISALTSAGRIINAEAMDNAQSWVAWLQSSSWIAALFFQFLPNVLVFVSMYILIPAALSYLSKFEQHLTVSGEQRAALIITIDLPHLFLCLSFVLNRNLLFVCGISHLAFDMFYICN